MRDFQEEFYSRLCSHICIDAPSTDFNQILHVEWYEVGCNHVEILVRKIEGLSIVGHWYNADLWTAFGVGIYCSHKPTDLVHMFGPRITGYPYSTRVHKSAGPHLVHARVCEGLNFKICDMSLT